jgi:hypothetical protein
VAAVVDGAAAAERARVAVVAQRAQVVAGSTAARLREGLPEPAGSLPEQLPAVGPRLLAAVRQPITGRRSVRPAALRWLEELPRAPQVEAGLRSNRAPARPLPRGEALPALVRVRRRDRPSRPVARESEPARRPALAVAHQRNALTGLDLDILFLAVV